ncbi:hypothetical protein ES703_95734 [subsurface metagenome]
MGASGYFSTRIDSPTTIGICAGVYRILEHVLKRHPTRTAPFQFALIGATAYPYRQFHSVVHQKPKHRVQCPELVELAEDKPDDFLRLFIRIKDDVSRRTFQVSDRYVENQLTTPRLVEPSLLHPLLENV